MKKLLVFIMINFIVCINFLTFAQENNSMIDEIDDTISSTNSITEYDSIVENNPILEDNLNLEERKEVNQESAGIGDVTAGFCNKGMDDISDSLKSAVNQGTPFKVCVIFKNNGNNDADIEVRIIDKVINGQGFEVCSYNSKNIQNFISQEDLNDLSQIHIPAQNYVIKEFNVNFPIGINGEQKSCLTYHVISKESSSAMLTTIYNRYRNMDFFVGDIGDIENKIDINDVNLYLNANKFLQLAFNIDNIGNLENQVVINGTLSNIFGFKKDFEFNIGNIGVGGSTTGIIDLGPLPNYGGLFNVSMTATATPYFSYNIDESSFDKDLLEQKDFTITASYFQMPRIAIIIFIFIIMFIIIAFKKPKKEVVYVQASQQQIPNNSYNGYTQPQQYQHPQYQQPQQPQQPQYQQPQQHQQPYQQ